jgi:hypothetical protein
MNNNELLELYYYTLLNRLNFKFFNNIYHFFERKD